jgi:preprotein translocase subunit YajC
MAAVLPPLVMILLLAGIFYLAWRDANKEKK